MLQDNDFDGANYENTAKIKIFSENFNTLSHIYPNLVTQFKNHLQDRKYLEYLPIQPHTVLTTLQRPLTLLILSPRNYCCRVQSSFCALSLSRAIKVLSHPTAIEKKRERAGWRQNTSQWSPFIDWNNQIDILFACTFFQSVYLRQTIDTDWRLTCVILGNNRRKVWSE